MIHLALLILLAVQPTVGAGDAISSAPIIAALRETESAPSKGDAADDPAIWVHPTDPQKSLILGTNKDGGLMVFDLAGKQVQYFADTKPNNVDLRTGFLRDGKAVAIAVASDRAKNTLLAWSIDADTGLLAALPVEGVAPSTEVYGFCLYKDADDALYGVITTKTGVMEQWRLAPEDNGNKLVATLARTLKFGSQCEGCIADDEHATLFVGEEARGVWKVSAEPVDTAKPLKIADIAPKGHLVADVEGLALFTLGEDGGYLIVSSQGSSEFCVFERGGAHAFLGSFKVAAENGMDPVTETDGIAVVSGSVGADFLGGLFVAQDDENNGGNQNFKLAAWKDIATALKLTVGSR